jgi:hypothetical protein
MAAWKHRARGVVVAAALLGIAPAAQAAGPTAADLAELQNFQLTDGFFSKWETYEERAAADPCALSPLMVLKDADEQSLGQIEDHFAARPGVKQALAESGLTAHEAMLGMMTLFAAAAQTIAQKHPEFADGDDKPAFTVSAGNMAAYAAHKDELHEHQTKLAREQLRKNKGKLPACLSGK